MKAVIATGCGEAVAAKAENEAGLLGSNAIVKNERKKYMLHQLPLVPGQALRSH